MNPMTGLRARPEVLRLIVENLATAVLLFNGDLYLLAANPAAEALLEVSSNKIVGLPPKGIFLDADYWESVLRWGMEARRPFTEREVELRLATLGTIAVDCTVTPFFEPGEREGLLVELVRVDRHRRITREEQMLAQHETAHTVVRGLAHEIRNPLGGLRGAAQLLERELKEPFLKEYTNVIIGEADRLQNLLDRLLGPRTVPHRRLINIHQAVERVCTLVKAEAPPGVRLRCDYDPSIPDFQADPDLIIQAVLNVARNAVQAVGSEGNIVVRTRVHRHVTIGQKHHRLVACVDVIDDGPGIPPDMVEKVFYPMVSGRPGGSGLGLSIAQSLVHQHGGVIQCSSRPGETVISTLLPLELEE